MPDGTAPTASEEAPILPAVCREERRRADLRRDPDLQGIDYLEVRPQGGRGGRPALAVHFVATPDRSRLEAVVRELANDWRDAPGDRKGAAVRILGGERRPVEVVEVRAETDAGEHTLVVETAAEGDFSTYTLVLRHDELDPSFSASDFTFKVDCPSHFDCEPGAPPAPLPESEGPPVDYMAKDFASFRRALEDLAPRLSPDWEEFHAADVGTALIELLAHAADQLSYFQDAVANEAYLQTARRRISVRRHARLVDYPMHDGASARTVIHVAVEGVSSARTLPRGTQFLTHLEGGLSGVPGPPPAAIPAEVRREAAGKADAVFESRREVRVHPDLNCLPIHTWGEVECHLPEGATSVDLEGNYQKPEDGGGAAGRAYFERGDLLLLEEVYGPTTGREADADPTRRQVVRVQNVELHEDPLPDESGSRDVTRVHWRDEDALDRSFCLATRYEPGDDGDAAAVELCGEEVTAREIRPTVARGNLVVADHGRRRAPGPDADRPAPATDGARAEGRYRVEVPGVDRTQSGAGDGRPPRVRLREAPLSYWTPPPDRDEPARRLVEHEGHERARAARPPVVAKGEPPQGTAWEPIETLLDAGPFDPRFVVETDDRGRAELRFGDGVLGRRPASGAVFEVTYRTGVGPAGEVGFGALSHLMLPEDVPGVPEDLRARGAAGADPCGDGSAPERLEASQVAGVRNPLPARGGVAPESAERVKRLAPEAFRAEQFRAVTEDDYASVAEEHPEVSAAVAEFRWTGSWHTVFLVLDPVGRTGLPPKLAEAVRERVAGQALAGYDLEVLPPRYVPLDVGLRVCVEPDHFRSDVEEAVRARLVGPRRGPSEPFFHPDRFTFGEPLYLSELLAAVEGVEGVDWVEPTRLRRFGEEGPSAAIDAAVFTVGSQEVVRLEHDRSFPERGVLRLEMRGGR